MRGKHNKLGEGDRKVRLGQDSLPNIVISIVETSRNYIRCFTRTPSRMFNHSILILFCSESKKNFIKFAVGKKRVAGDKNESLTAEKKLLLPLLLLLIKIVMVTSLSLLFLFICRENELGRD